MQPGYSPTLYHLQPFQLLCLSLGWTRQEGHGKEDAVCGVGLMPTGDGEMDSPDPLVSAPGDTRTLHAWAGPSHIPWSSCRGNFGSNDTGEVLGAPVHSAGIMEDCTGRAGLSGAGPSLETQNINTRGETQTLPLPRGCSHTLC